MWDWETWESLKGRGCWYCKYGKPVVVLHHSAACFTCFGRWFPSWTDTQVADWLEAQWAKAGRVVVREEARQLELAIY